MIALTALKVLILAGGLSPDQNHHSHLVHVQGLQALLADRGVPPEDVAVFWADGLDPAPDRAVLRTSDVPDAWLLAGLPVAERHAPQPLLEHTEFPPIAPSPGRSSGPAPVRPAKRAALQAWLTEVGPTLGAGDTLLIAVTDHGSPGPDGVARIELWGGETWNPLELLEDLAPVPEPARVALWMSQCFSGGFADLYRQRANLCGAFSTSADRVAYGCHPELARRTEVGHFQRMLEALDRHGSLAAATDEVMRTDDTPDVPHLTSDALLFGRLVETAEAAGTDLPVFIDTRLPRDAPEEPLRAAIALRYGLGLLRDYSATADLLDVIGEARHAASGFAQAWHQADEVARMRVVEGVLAQAPDPDAGDREAGWRTLVAAARQAWSRVAPADQARIRRLYAQVQAAEDLVSRLDLQEAAALRVAWLLGRSAGPAVLAPSEKRTLQALQACEAAPLWAGRAGAPVTEAEALPPAVQALAAVETLRPGHLGLAFRDKSGFEGVVVERLLPGSVLHAVDLRPGDELLAVNGEAVRERGGFRERVMLTAPGTPLRLTGRRGKAPLDLRLPSPPMPVAPPPPQPGDVVGDLRLAPLSVPLPPLGEGQPTVLFFWATWCKPCKAALPALRTWAATHQVRVVAITDEDAPTVQKFLKGFGQFPFPIALDVEDEAHRVFGVPVRPYFVLLDSERRFVQAAEGFDHEIPLEPPPR